jgi:pyruvate kinase
MERRTKIVATVGPASDRLETLRAMIAAGVDMVRLSLSHGPLVETLSRICQVREAGDAEGRIVGVLADLPGPKIRAAAFPEGGVHLAEGARLELAPAATTPATNSASPSTIRRCSRTSGPGMPWCSGTALPAWSSRRSERRGPSPSCRPAAGPRDGRE